ncbi:MAG TPA: BTAD domain-containing putative transcriptional regulator, partial [Streptosporangiaceae bacterium]
RQSEALRAYQRARTALVDGLGIEPGEALRGAERAVLNRDPSLLSPRVPAAAQLPAAVAAITAPRLAGRRSELVPRQATFARFTSSRSAWSSAWRFRQAM